MENKFELRCEKDEELNLYLARVTHKQGFTCGQGFGKTEAEAITEACSNALPYIKIKYNDKVLFELCLNWKQTV